MTDDGAGVETGGADPTLGERLAGLRKQRGLTGEALGARIGMSQSKVSKIEQGRVRPSVVDVERIAKALDAPEETLASLVDLADRLLSSPRRQPLPERRTGEGQGFGQQEFLECESEAHHIRNFEIMIVPGLLQISEYSRRIFISFFEFTYGDTESRYHETAKAVSTRTLRQERLYDEGRTFEFVIMESALSSPLLTPGYMLAQIDRLEFVAEQPNITIRIVPNGVELRSPAVYGFTLLDDVGVLTEVGHTPIYLTDHENVAFHQRHFDYFRDVAAPDIAPILTKYKTLYADQARPRD